MTVRVNIPVTDVAVQAAGIDAGIVDTVPVTAGPAATTTLAAAGYYKIAAMGTSLLWRLGATDVDAATGSYLADGDQEIIFAGVDALDLSYLDSANGIGLGTGEINIARVIFKEINTENPTGQTPPF